jgi:hypothetical protein
LVSEDRKQSQTENEEDGFSCQLVSLRLNELRPHRSYARNKLSVSVSQLSALAALGEFAFRQPVTITKDGSILDGYARWELARRQKRNTILCLVCHVTQAEALRWLIQSHRPSAGWDAYSRVLLGHDLEPHLQEKARANQRAGGKNKGPSSLTEAETLDVRSEISSATGVSAGNLTKVKHLRKQAHPRVEQALRDGDLSIHKAWILSHLPGLRQVRELEEHQTQKGLNKTSSQLIRKHVATLSPLSSPRATLAELLSPLSGKLTPELGSIAVAEIDFTGKIAYFTKDALRILQTLGRQNGRSESAEANFGSYEGSLGST